MTKQQQNAAILDVYGDAPAQPVTLSTDKPSLSQKERAESIFNAIAAVRKGKSADAVRQKLRDAGIDPSEAGL